MRVPALISFFLLCCGLASGCWEDVTTQVAATVLSVKGAVVFGMAEQNNFQPVTRESRIHDGSSVRTLDGARLNLALLPSALLQLSSNSEIEIEELRISKDGNETGDAMRSRSARIRLNWGKITILFSRSDKSASQFTISAPQAPITADSDCLFCVQSAGATTRLTCVRGKIYTSHSGQPSVAIGAGYFQQWPSGRAEPMAASDDAAAQIDVVDSLEIENQLRELQSGWQKRRPF
jgi:FecR protein.